MKQLLEYTDNDLNNLSIDELSELANEASKKETELNVGQMTLKILMNSLYGAMANKHFPLFNESIAQAITGNGRYFIRGLGEYVEQRLQEIIPNDSGYWLASDTDSAYFTIAPFIKKFLNKKQDASITDLVNFCQEIEEKVIDNAVNDFIDLYSFELNAYSKEMIGAKREVISDRALFVAKKKYAMQVRDKEGTRYPENSPYIKVQGLEVIKGGTPAFTKKHLLQMVPMLLNSTEQEVKNHLSKLKTQFLSQDIIDICIGQGVTSIDYKLTDSAIPNGSRAAIIFNEYIKNNNLIDQYGLIQSGANIKKLFLRLPNKFNSDVIGFEDERFTKEVFTPEIDYDKMFEKGFLSALENMTDALNWNLGKETETLDEW